MLEALYNAIRKDAKPVIVEVNGKKYSTSDLKPVREPKPEAITVKNLSSLVDFLSRNVDDLPLDKLICHVESPDTVSIKSALMGDHEDRKTYIIAKLDQLQLPVNEWIPSEKFCIAMQACFTDDAIKPTDRGLVLKFAANVKTTLENTLSDDGVTQGVTVRKNLVSVENTTMPNPVTLRPFRTFTEVEQPASSFVFRAQDKDGMHFMLVESDGGAWRSEAMAAIKQFMQEAVDGLNVIA